MPNLTPKEIKQRYFDRVYAEAKIIPCACGCEQTTKDKDHYGRSKSYISGHNGRKYDDPREYKRAYNRRHRPERYDLKHATAYKRKIEVIRYKGGQCNRCGVTYDGKNAAIFDFHHRNPLEKESPLNLAYFQRLGINRIYDEACKCDLLCANCHRLVHAQEY